MSETITLKKNEKPADELVDIEINLPPHSSMIVLDGHHYFHGFSYKFKPAQVATIKEIMHNAWRHEQEVRGQRKPFDMRHRPQTI